MKCPEAMENLAAYLDGELDGAPRRAMDAHFADCAACAGERHAEAATWRLLDLVEAPAAPADFDGRVLAAARSAGSPRGRILGLPRPAAAAAAVILAAGGGFLLLRGDGGGVGAGAATGVAPPAGGAGAAAAPPEALLENLAVIESLDVLQDADLDVVERLSDMGDEDLAVLGGG